MAVTTTSRLGLTQWSAGTDPFTRAQMTASFAALEANAAMYAQGTLAARPAFGKQGRFYYVDSGASVGLHFYDTGAAWVPVSPDLSSYATTSALTSGLAGKAATVHTHAAADVTSGVFATARLAGSGTASSSTFLRGDQTWSAAPAGSIATDTDVVLTAVANGQFLRWNSTTSKWNNVAIAESDVTNLVTDLAGKAATVHTHTKSQITDFAHTHLIADLPVASSGTSSSSLLVRADDSRLADSRAPSGAASGHLSGTYPSPQVIQVGFTATNPTTASVPNDYNTGAKWFQKTSAAVSIPDGSTNVWLLGFRIGPDSTAGNAWEYGYTDAGNVYRRRGATTTWGSWQQVEKAGVATVFADTTVFAPVASPTFSGTVTVGTADTDIFKLRAYEAQTHTRNTTPTYTGGLLTQEVEKAGSTTVCTTTYTYTGTLLTQVQEVVVGSPTITITTTITYDSAGNYTGETRTVV